MDTRWKVLIVTLVVAVPAFMLGAGTPMGESLWRAVWAWDTVGEAEPGSGQVPFFMVIGAVEAISLGLAVSLVAFGWPAIRRISGPARGRAVLMFVAATWLLGNWWVHDNLHMVNGENFTGLLVLEYAFHVTLIVAAAGLGLGLVNSAREGRLTGTEASGTTETPAVA